MDNSDQISEARYLSDLGSGLEPSEGGWILRVADSGNDTGPDIVARSESMSIGFEVKVVRRDLPDEALVRIASVAERLRRSMTDRPTSKVVLILISQRDSLHMESIFDDPATTRLSGRLTAKSGFDAVIFADDGFDLPFSVVPPVRMRVSMRSVQGHKILPLLERWFSNEISLKNRGSNHGDPAVQTHSAIPARRPAPRKFLLVSDEWNAGKGGISSFNRELAVALHKAGKEVCVYLPTATEAEIEEASSLGIDIAIPTKSIPGLNGSSALLAQQIRHLNNQRYKPDVIVGHGRVLGPHAYYVQGLFGETAPLRVHIVHTNPELLELAKEGDSHEPRTRIAQDRRALELELASSADLVAGVGPSLFSWIHDDLRANDSTVPTMQINPGLRDWGSPRDASLVPAQREFLLVARVEDFESKGVELAVRAVGTASQTYRGAEQIQLVLRGVPDDHIALRDRVNGIASEYGLSVVFRGYSANVADVRTDLRKAIAVLMPSVHEGFGLSAYEAVAMGTPVIISRDSGLAKFLKELWTGGKVSSRVESHSATSTDRVEVWSEAINRILLDPHAALRTASHLRSEIDDLYLWEDSIRDLEDLLERSTPIRAST